MKKVTIYHNPRCSKSRQTLELLQKKGTQPEIILYLQTPPTPEKIKEILTQLNLTPRELIRKKETPYKENNLENPNLTETQLIQAMHDNPILIERPIVQTNNKAALGRPPENILTIL